MKNARFFVTHLARCLALLIVAVSALADTKPLLSFADGSYNKLLSAREGRPFVLVIWSQTCSSCLKEMSALNDWRQDSQSVEMILLSTDDISEQEEVSQILKKNGLDSLENWIFADENTQKLRFQIDPRWYGELPRMYFFNAQHKRTGISGVLSKKDYLDKISSL